jgi:hypothetical protein
MCRQPDSECNTDSDCATIHDAAPQKPMVCEPAGPCVCPQGGGRGECVPACQSASDCGPNQLCTAGHCGAKPCATEADCPSVNGVLFGCNTGKCGLKSCGSDADCSGQYCVNGTCSKEPGVCTPPAA